MAIVYFGGPLDEIRAIMEAGLQAKHRIRATLLEAMIDARNSVGLNRRFKPAVLVIEQLPDTALLNQNSDFSFPCIKNVKSTIKRIYSVKIDFKAPNLASIAGTLSPYAVLQGKNEKHSFHKGVAR
ncbi:hypothetical protein Dred_0725 [Desulforamulus reducens MI-1]|uniref:Uncharacterized protein n=1 Tax=Desulforamulus reducens (strain ATCC BAA-1160 / DSM 100696 / MI-1) TaxID=349161 RepID=A4J2G1_DESRM|nr:hypothetical protein [Desulforamulus reducens]ABO49264.1 hypothetical protein Dred_0725 [Desulforamulus reducens MI-1]